MCKDGFFEKDLLPLQSIALARFVTDIQHPLRNYHDPFPAARLFSLSLTRQAAQSFRVSGEAVYAVKHCKVSFKWYSSRTVEKSFLGRTCWKVSWSARGSEGQDEEDVVEAVLGEEDEGAGAGGGGGGGGGERDEAEGSKVQ